MRLARTLKRRFGITAPRMWVRAHIPWYWRWPILLLMLGVGLALAWTMYESGMQFAGFERGNSEREMARLSAEVSRLHAENVRLQAALANSERQLSVERATQADLAKSVKALQEDNAHLKEDLLFFQKPPASTKLRSK